MVIWSIGHSNHPVDRFIELLNEAEIEVVADVRSVPYSRFHPQFRQRALEATLVLDGIDYAFLGDELGGRPPESELRDEAGNVRYDVLVTTERFQSGLNRLAAIAADRRIAMMCSEEDPARCHRSVAIAPALAARDVEVVHIRGRRPEPLPLTLL